MNAHAPIGPVPSGIQGMVEHAPLPMAQVEGVTHVVRSINAAFCLLFSRRREDLIGRPFLDLYPLGDGPLDLLDHVYHDGRSGSQLIEEGDEPDPIYRNYTAWPLQGTESLMVQVTGSDAPHKHGAVVDKALVAVMVKMKESDAAQKRATAINEALFINAVRQQERGEGSDRLNQRLLKEIQDRDRIAAALQESERQLRTLADSIPNLAWMARPDGYVFWYNQRWFDYTGSTLEESQGWSWQSMLDPAEQPRVVAKITAAFAQGEAWEDTFQLRRHDGEMRWHLGRMLPVHDANGAVTRWFGTNTDITDERRMEQDLRDQGVALAEADRRKTEFLATLAHELRNPLAPLRSGLELLALSTDDRSTWDRAHATMGRQLDHMVRLIDELMDLSRITRGIIDLRTERMDLRTILEQALETSRPLIERQGHTLVMDLPKEPLMIEGDGMRLTQVFCNLLNNAAKYTDPRGAISVRAEAGPDEARVVVEDNGIGIARDQLGRVFNMFAQVQRTGDRVQGGLGIGLNIVKHLVEMHGGQVHVRSEGIDTGSSFTVELPLSHGPVPAGPSALQKNASLILPPLRILLVDDNEDAATMMALLLGKLGHEVQVAHNGAEAMEMGERMAPSVILLDIGMPVMDGYSTCSLIRRSSWGRKVFIVALTGLGSEEDRRRSSEAGFDRHLVKPITTEALIAVIASMNGFGRAATDPA